MSRFISNDKKLTFLIGVGVGVLLLISGVFFLYFRKISVNENLVISSYEECVAAGNQVLYSYPPQCITEDGQTFSEEIGNEPELTNEIQVTNPRPDQLIEKTLEVSGQAVGLWLFEGRTSVKLFDTNNNIVAEGIVTAQSGWMTEKMVPFIGTLNFTQPNPQKGRLVIEKSNPSGLPENKKELIVPIYFK